MSEPTDGLELRSLSDPLRGAVDVEESEERLGALMMVGEFDLTLPGADDWDMWFRLTQNGYLAYVDRIILDYRRHPGNVSMQTERMSAVTEAMLWKRAASPDLSNVQRELQRGARSQIRVIAELRWHWAREHSERGHYWLAAKELRRALKAYVQFYTNSGDR